MSRISIILLILIPGIIWGQWSQMGASIDGGENDKLGSFKTTAMSGNGQRIAVASPFNQDAGLYAGYVKTFEWEGNDWMPLGDVFWGSQVLEATGASVSFDESGNTLAIGSSYAQNAMGWRTGGVRVFDWDGDTWIQRGLLIEGEGNPIPSHQIDLFGGSVSLSNDGNTIAIGGESNTMEVGVLHNQGHVKIYQWNGSEWEIKGDEINGIIGGEKFGGQVAINGDGNVVVIGGQGHWNADTTAMPGYVRVHEWTGSEWAMKGMPLIGSDLLTKYGSTVDIDEAGNTIAIGGFNGIVEVHEWDGTQWVERGNLHQEVTTFVQSVVGLSDDGNIIAIGEPWAANISGIVRILEWDGSAWNQIHNSITESASLAVLGSSIALNSDASRIVVGASGIDSGGFSAGQVKVFQDSPVVSSQNLKGDKHTISFFPNPTDGLLNLSHLQDEADARILSLDGKILLQQKLHANSTQLDISNFLAGVYILEVYSSKDYTRIKVVKH